MTYDKPNADGRVTLWPYQLDFQFEPPRENEAVGGAEGRQPVYGYSEFLPALRCVRPRGLAFMTAMQIAEGEWAVDVGKWRASQPAILRGRTAFLDYYDSRADQFGVITHGIAHWRNMAALVIRQAPAPNASTWPNFVAFEFLGNPLLEGAKRYAFLVPVNDPIHKNPIFTVDDATTSGSITKAAEWVNGGANQTTGNGVELDEFWFEWIDGCWHVRRSGVEEAWVCRVDDPAPLSVGPVRITVYGHACLVWFGDITYQAQSITTRNGYLYYDPSMFTATRNWHIHSWGPDTRWTVTPTEEANPNYADEFRPLLTVTQGNGDSNRPPAVWVTSCVATATQADISSSPVVLDKDNGYWVESIDYELNASGRGQTCTINVRDTLGTLPLKGNEKITVAVGWNREGEAASSAQKFQGYVARVTKEKTGASPLEVMVTIEVGDPIETRLTKKYMGMMSAAGGEDLPNWVYRVLYDHAVPASQLTSILAMAGQGPSIPQGMPKGDLRFAFDAQTCIIDALDQVTEACGREWGWNAETGLFFLRVPVTYSGTPDFTLDETTETAAGFAWRLQHDISPEDYRNVLYILSETAGEAESELWYDNGSRATPGDASYIGDDWWEVIVETDAPTPTGKAQKRWHELLKEHSLVGWEMTGRTDLGPGKYVKMQVTRAGVTTDAIYQITNERGTLTWGRDDPKFRQSFESRIWETS